MVAYEIKLSDSRRKAVGFASWERLSSCVKWVQEKHTAECRLMETAMSNRINLLNSLTVHCRIVRLLLHRYFHCTTTCRSTSRQRSVVIDPRCAFDSSLCTKRLLPMLCLYCQYYHLSCRLVRSTAAISASSMSRERISVGYSSN